MIHDSVTPHNKDARLDQPSIVVARAAPPHPRSRGYPELSGKAAVP